MPRKMLILGALPSPCEGTWVPIGKGVWLCDAVPQLAHRVRIDVEDHEGQIHSFMMNEVQVAVEGKRVRAVVLEEIRDLERVHLGMRRVS